MPLFIQGMDAVQTKVDEDQPSEVKIVFTPPKGDKDGVVKMTLPSADIVKVRIDCLN